MWYIYSFGEWCARMYYNIKIVSRLYKSWTANTSFGSHRLFTVIVANTHNLKTKLLIINNLVFSGTNFSALVKHYFSYMQKLPISRNYQSGSFIF
jgi:hypothetical protein